jgi:hypothetical protein
VSLNSAMSRALMALVLLCLSAPLLAQDWQLTTADFNNARVNLQGTDQNGITVTDPASAQQQTIAFDNFLQIQRQVGAQPQRSPFVLQLVSGERVAGQPAGVADEQLRWTNPALGELQFPLQSAAAMYRAAGEAASSGAQPSRLDASRPQDVLTLSNGDIVAGIIRDISGESITVASDGVDIPVPLDSVVSVVFATTGAAAPPRDRAFRVTISDDSTVTAQAIATEGEHLRLTLRGGETRDIPMAQVLRIEQINGPVVWLSSLEPAENVHVPYFTDLASPAQFDRSVSGEPIRFEDQTFARGIGVHSYSRLSWPVDPQYKTFRTRYAIAGELPYADVTVRVKLDDRVVHERKNVRSRELSPVIEVDLAGAKTLTLEVDYGDAYDVQDRLNWIEPALLR